MDVSLDDTGLYDPGTPTIEVRVFREDRLLAVELCEDEQEVAEIVARWSEHDVTFLVDDLGTHHSPEDILSPELPADGGDALSEPRSAGDEGE